MPRVYTRSGDDGTTALLYGRRVSKADPRCEAYGAVDEAISAMGLARALAQDPRVKEVLRETAQELFTVATELATDISDHDRAAHDFGTVSSEMVQRLEGMIDDLKGGMELPNAFILPGSSVGSAAIDVARAVLRRAERRIVALKDQGLLASGEVLRYVNRLSDLLWVLARYEDRGLPLDAVSGRRATQGSRKAREERSAPEGTAG
ncbi:MAG: cob(I)yrinic acid a,c-diamide adenosyltransferase [Chloroflexi bacterium]|nr:cob(I)yrinic acid a,c-diamide adenosyltransferase [Chloroflexota bacterium]